MVDPTRGKSQPPQRSSCPLPPYTERQRYRPEQGSQEGSNHHNRIPPPHACAFEEARFGQPPRRQEPQARDRNPQNPKTTTEHQRARQQPRPRWVDRPHQANARDQNGAEETSTSSLGRRFVGSRARGCRIVRGIGFQSPRSRHETTIV